MKRKFLEDLGLEKETIDKIMDENGNDINAAKAEVDALKQQAETSEKQLKERDKQLENLKKSSGDNEELKNQIASLQEENKATREKYESDIKELKLSTAIKLALGDSTQDSDLVAGLIDQSKLILSEDGKVSGLDEQLKALKKEKAFLFKEDKVPETKLKGGEPAGGSGGLPTEKKPSEMTYSEMCAYLEKNPGAKIE